MTIILLTYVNRSGSTYLANLLSASDKICVCPEGDKLVNLFLEAPEKPFNLNNQWIEKLEQIFQSDPKLKSWEIDNNIFAYLKGVDKNIDAFLAILHYYQLKHKPGAVSIFFKAERLVDLYPAIEKAGGQNIDFKYLSLIRDPRAIYESQRRTLIPGTDKRMSRNPIFTAIFWNHYIKAVRINQKNVKCHQIFYHHLVKNISKTLSGISAHLEIDVTGIIPEGGDLMVRLPDNQKPIHQKISQIPDEKMIENWKKDLSQAEISLINRKCYKNLIEFNFGIDNKKQMGLSLYLEEIYFTIAYKIIHRLHIIRFHMKRIFK